ncbi:MAG: DUF302 domain-containing protein [Spirochaetales bacterium]|nr:DUF302 domain-containing protein [Spirochaetales bacterium]
MSEYGLYKDLKLDVDLAEQKISEELKKEGFGVLTRIDMSAKFKEKLGIDYKKYIILGACNPPFAHKAVEAEENIGLLLPCNVIIYETGTGVRVGIIKPSAAMSMVENPVLNNIAIQIEQKLKSALDRL